LFVLLIVNHCFVTDRLIQSLGNGLYLGHYSPYQRLIFVKRIHVDKKSFDPDICCLRPSCSYLAFCEEAFFDNDNLVLLYEHCGKTILKDLIDKKCDFNEEIVKSILYQVLLGLDCLHSRNMFHGNLTASVIHVNEIGRVKVSLINFVFYFSCYS
jgi:serine/threonine protein kinase